MDKFSPGCHSHDEMVNCQAREKNLRKFSGLIYIARNLFCALGLQFVIISELGT